jgi:hypothetical protein
MLIKKLDGCRRERGEHIPCRLDSIAWRAQLTRRPDDPGRVYDMRWGYPGTVI